MDVGSIAIYIVFIVFNKNGYEGDKYTFNKFYDFVNGVNKNDK